MTLRPVAAGLRVVAEPGVASGPRVAVLADDLMWATRLADIVRRAGGVPVRVASAALLRAALSTLDGCIVDLTARSYDGVAAIATAATAAVPCVAVGQHDDTEQRRAAREAGAGRVYAYRALFEHGDRDLGGWVATLGGGDRRRGGSAAGSTGGRSGPGGGTSG